MKNLIQRNQNRLFSVVKYTKYKHNKPHTNATVAYKTNIVDSTRWNEITMKENEPVVVTPMKAGTTLVIEIIAQLYKIKGLHNEQEQSVHGKHIWPESNRLPIENVNQIINEKRRNGDIIIWKSHLAAETLNFSPNNKYIFIGRDYRDMIWSLYNHHINYTHETYKALFGKDKPLMDNYMEMDLWNDMLNKPDAINNPDGFVYWSLLWVVGSWWKCRNLPNVKLLHYNDLMNNLSAQIAEIAMFLNIDVGLGEICDVAELCSMQNMRKRGSSVADKMWKGGINTFIYKGTNERWVNDLTNDDIEQYRLLASRYMSDNAVYWLETGKYKN
eukprot:435334_1